MNVHDEAVIATPIGMVRITGAEHFLTSIAIERGESREHEGVSALLRDAAAQLRDYFAGERTSFDLPLEPARTSRGAVLRGAMRAIGYGETATYGAVAAAVVSSPRAVGRACALNPFPIVVPCHRVTSAGGPEHYSAGGGAMTKCWLIDHERRHRPPIERG